MKRLATGLIMLTLSAAAASASGEGWLTDFEAARKMAAEKERPILVDFSGSDWCGWCMKLEKEVFSTEAFKTYARDNLVLFLADFPSSKPQSDEIRKQNKTLMEKYGIRGFPTIILLDAAGKKLAQTGYRDGGPDTYVKHLQDLLKNAPTQ